MQETARLWARSSHRGPRPQSGSAERKPVSVGIDAGPIGRTWWEIVLQSGRKWGTVAAVVTGPEWRGSSHSATSVQNLFPVAMTRNGEPLGVSGPPRTFAGREEPAQHPGGIPRRL